MKNNYLLFLLLLSQTIILSAQSGKQKKADRLYEDFAYNKAIEVYEDLLDRNYNTEHNQKKLADSYLMLRDPENAVKFYEAVVQQPDISPGYYFKYAQALRGVREYEESREWLKRYMEEGKTNPQVKEMIDGDAINIHKGYESYRLEPVSFNSKFSDFGAVKQNGRIMFTSSRAEGSNRDKIYDWNGEPFLDIYEAQPDGQNPLPVKGDVNTVRHEGPITFSADGKTLFFTRNNYINNRNGKKDEEGINHLKIYKATLEGSAWTNIEELPFNSNEYSVGHPSLSADGKTLYFASEAPGGMGGADLYKVTIKNGTYSSPENLGEHINTAGNEVFPFIATNDKLYFSSDGHPGYGLLDIFVVSEEGEVQNLGEPINSSHDDFSFFTVAEESMGYISSNRSGGVGGDDIFKTTILAPLVLVGTITDSINGQPIANASFRLLNEEQEQIAFLETDSLGDYSTPVYRNRTYGSEAAHIKYTTKTGSISTSNLDDQVELRYDIVLVPVNDVEFLAEINKIYFDFDKYDIREDAAKELDKLVNLMKNDYPDLVIEIGSHTDSRGSIEYNRRLAERRAKSTFDYLVANGVEEERIITYKGYGEENPDQDCDRCSESQHQLNRRSIFKVVKME